MLIADERALSCVKVKAVAAICDVTTQSAAAFSSLFFVLQAVHSYLGFSS
jgi:hypothetical protein